jgi:hypothetical protein
MFGRCGAGRLWALAPAATVSPTTVSSANVQ